MVLITRLQYLTIEPVDTERSTIDRYELLSNDEIDAWSIVWWFKADPTAPVPASARYDEGILYAHRNPDAWALVAEYQLPAGMNIAQAKAAMEAAELVGRV